jgi:hypothetical protein
VIPQSVCSLKELLKPIQKARFPQEKNLFLTQKYVDPYFFIALGMKSLNGWNTKKTNSVE